MVRIRLKRLGRKKSPFYRIVVMNKRDRRNGRPIEELGYYNPMSKELKLNKASLNAWIAKGAQPSETVAYLATLAPEDGSLIQLPKKAKKEHLGEANQVKEKVAEELAVEEAVLEDVVAEEEATETEVAEVVEGVIAEVETTEAVAEEAEAEVIEEAVAEVEAEVAEVVEEATAEAEAEEIAKEETPTDA
jgi:small subunit ribosomal protein S16